MNMVIIIYRFHFNFTRNAPSPAVVTFINSLRRSFLFNSVQTREVIEVPGVLGFVVLALIRSVVKFR